MNSEPSSFITARRDDAATTAASYNKWLAEKFWVVFAFNSHKKSIEIQVYDVPFHTSK
jgi:hypothetical protein